MKLPVIRGKIGDWTYYSGVMTFEDIAKNVKPSIGEIYQATCLDELLQRELTENYNGIKQYLLCDKERFFNAIILAIFDGDPQWLEVEFPEEEREYTNVGFLELTGGETIFPIDGQHRVKGIIEALTVAPTLAKEQVPILFVAHSQTEDGRKRTRKLFSTLNRRNKPVGANENIALDEDDVCAIITRDLIQSFPLFMGNNIVNTKGKQIPVGNENAITSLIALYQIVDILVQQKLIDDGITTPSKFKDYKLSRPDDNTVQRLSQYITAVMTSFVNASEAISMYSNDTSKNKASVYRNKDGGHILFRPVVITEYFRAAALLSSRLQIPFSEVFEKLNTINSNLSESPWKGLVWNGSAIINRVSKTLLKNLFLFLSSGDSVLTAKDIEKLYQDYGKALNIDENQARMIINNQE